MKRDMKLFLGISGIESSLSTRYAANSMKEVETGESGSSNITGVPWAKKLIKSLFSGMMHKIGTSIIASTSSGNRNSSSYLSRFKTTPRMLIPILSASNLVLMAALTYLFVRRVVNPQIKYISLLSDYFPLFLLLGIGISGILMRHFYKVYVVEVKVLAMGLLNFKPVVSDSIGIIFFIHLFLVSFLIGYFPFSKLLHMPGIFLSPTRNMVNNSRIKRHVNPWDYPVGVHTYEEYEDEFREHMKASGLPLDKE